MEIIEDVAIVKEVKDNKVLVEIAGAESCNSCSFKGMCSHKGEPRDIWVETEYELSQGDKVKLFISPALKIASSFTVFLLPIIIMLTFYLVSKYLFSISEDISILVSILSLGISGLLIWVFDKKWSKRIKFEIVEVIKNYRTGEDDNEDQIK